MSSDELMQRIADSYRKIRNTFRYILGNLEAFDPACDVVPFAEMHPLDQYILAAAAELARTSAPPTTASTSTAPITRSTSSEHRPQRALPRRPQRPPLHLRAKPSRPTQRANRALAHRRGPHPPASPPSSVSPPTRSGTSAKVDGRPYPAFISPTSLLPRSDRRPSSSLRCRRNQRAIRQTLLSVRDEALKAARSRAPPRSAIGSGP